MGDVRGSYNNIRVDFITEEAINASFSDLAKAVESGATIDLISIAYSDGAVSAYTRAILVQLEYSSDTYTAIFYDGNEDNKVYFTATDKNALMTYKEP